MNCIHCGKTLADNAQFCDGCGTPITSPLQPPVNTPVGEKDNKVIFILSYILFFLPLVACPTSKPGRFHANQGLVLLLTSVVGQIVISILSSIFIAISWRLWFLGSVLSTVWYLGILALVIIGMIRAGKDEQKPLPSSAALS